MKRENNQNDDSQDDGSDSGNGGGSMSNNNKRSRRNNDEQLRLLIPSRIAGAIIGKGGQHIQKLRTTYKCFVSVDDCQGPERTILVSSDFESIVSIMKDILKYYEERDGEVDVRVLIHQSLAGCVIGKGGSKIKEIRDKVGCRVLKVFPSTAPQSSDRVVQVIGKLEQTVDAVKEVLLLTKDTAIRGPVNSYDPINYDDMYAVDYGGYGVPSQNGGYRDRDRYDRGRNDDRYNDRRRDRSRSRGRDRDFISPWANDGPMSGGGFGGFGSGGGNNSGGFGGFGPGSGGFGGGNGPNFGSGGGNFGSSGFGNNGPSFGSGGGGGFGGGSGFGGGQGGGFGGGNMGMGNGNNNLGGMGGANSGGGGFGNSGGNMNGGNNGGGGGDGKNSTQVTIPKDLAGAIIGKNGQRIRRIRNESNAYITIDEPLPGSNDRIITISGTPKQIQMAQYLLQQSVLDSRK